MSAFRAGFETIAPAADGHERLTSVALHRAGVLVSSVHLGEKKRQVVGASPVPSPAPRRKRREKAPSPLRVRSIRSNHRLPIPAVQRHAARWRSRAGGIPTKTAAPATASRVTRRASEREKRGERSDPASPNLNGLRHPGGARPRHRPRPRPPPPRRARPPHRHGARRRRRAGAPSLAPLRRRASRRRCPHRRACPRPRLLDLQARHRRVQAPCAEQETLDRQPQARSGCLGACSLFAV